MVAPNVANIVACLPVRFGLCFQFILDTLLAVTVLVLLAVSAKALDELRRHTDKQRVNAGKAFRSDTLWKIVLCCV